MSSKHVVRLDTSGPVRINKWKVSEGTIIYDGRVLLLYEPPDGGKASKLKSKVVGTVSRLLVKEGDTVKLGTPLVEVDEGCSHPTVINDLCAECGADLQKDGAEPSQATIPMLHSIPQLKVSHEQAQRIGKADMDRLIKERKLVLLVDLDQTLIHTTHDNIPNNIKDIHHFQLYGSHNPWYHTRLRPGTQRFLHTMKEFYELHICTFGVRPYAHMVAHILDKDASLFSNRILSRDECFDSNSKHANLHALFPCGDELVCIIDDREDVWNYSPNLIQVKPYLFFKNTGDIHDPNLSPVIKAASCQAKGVQVKTRGSKKEKEGEKEEDKKEMESTNKEEDGEIEIEEEDDYLLDLEVVLKKVHKCFYKIFDKKKEGVADVKWVLHHLRSKVLKNCVLVFSGLVPLRVELEESEPFLLARKLGATVARELSESTTHLVAATRGTAKVHQAKRMRHVKVVSPHWLVSCGHRWEKVDERLFEVGTGGPNPFGKSTKDVQPTAEVLTISKEDMDAMNEEVGDLDSDTDTDPDNPPVNSNPSSESGSDVENGDGENDSLFQMAQLIEKGLDTPEDA